MQIKDIAMSLSKSVKSINEGVIRWKHTWMHEWIKNKLVSR